MVALQGGPEEYVTGSRNKTMSTQTPHHASAGDTLDRYMPVEDLIPCRHPEGKAWGRLRWRSFIDLIWHFSTWRNLRNYPRNLLADITGFAWAGIYRSMTVPSIASTSLKNEGHFRPRERILGTESFFGTTFRFPPGSSRMNQILQKVNLRHHVAGVVVRKGDTVEVVPHYEAAFAYVSTAFIECLRDGYAACGVPPDSAKGRRIASDLCQILYPISGWVGLTRMPRDLEAHERFRDAFERRLWELPRSPWLNSQTRELAKRIFPYTAARSSLSMETLLHRHLDRRTAQYLFPDPAALDEIRPTFEAYSREVRGQKQSALNLLRDQFSRTRVPPARPGLEELWKAYRKAPDNSTAARMVGAVLLYALEAPTDATSWLPPQDLHLDPSEPLFRQGQVHHHCYIVLESSATLVVTRRGVPGTDSEAEAEIAQVDAPTLIGEIGLWRKRPAIATVICRVPIRLRVVRLDEAAFAQLKTHSGFWHAVAAEVQRRLQISMRGLEQGLLQLASRTADPEVTAVLELIRHINGNVEARLDLVPGIHPEVSLAECIDLLRQKVSHLHGRMQEDPAACVALENLLDVIG
ncbi:MAG: hypothetical protein RLZ45_2464 [Verrucomicrobiota bacterium]|jgi:CRP-like cAMP-binding protein